MPRVPFIRTTTPQGTDTLMLAVNGEPHMIDASHPRFEQILTLVKDKHSKEDFPEVEELLLTLIRFAQEALNTMRSLSERVSVKGDTIFFDGDPVEDPISEHILKMIREGDDTWQAPVNFLENLQANPAKHVRKRLYEWIGKRSLSLTPEGHVIGYKGVRNDDDNSSVTSGSNTVYVDSVEHTEHTGHIPNPIGATVTIARSQVDANRDTECSYGLHVGTHDYASSFGAKLLTVSFNPRDVVAIPRGEGHSKIRTCRYQVLAVSDAVYQGTTYVPAEEADEDEVCDGGCGYHPDDCACDDPEASEY